MVGEKLNQNSETTPNQNDSFEYPPFDLEKAKEQVAKARMLSSVEEISNDELRQRVLDHEEELKRRQERMERDEKIASLADEAEARLGRNLSQEELQDLAESYDAWLKNPNKESEQSPEREYSEAETNFDPTLYTSESEWRAANSESAQRRREQQDVIAITPSNDQTHEQSNSNEQQEEIPTAHIDVKEPTEKQNKADSGDESKVETNAEEEQNIELLSENEVRNVLGLLDASELNVDQIFMISRGSRSSEESATVLKRMFQNMTERSSAMLSELQNGRNLGELEAFGSVYEDDMSKSFGYSMQALKTLREKARMLPGQMAGGFVFQLQQVENNLLAINNLVTRRHNPNARDKNSTIPKEKLVTDEREAENYVDRSMFGY